MKTRKQKVEDLSRLSAKAPGASITVLTSFAREGESGLTVAQLDQLKKVLREGNSEYVVAKKTLIDLMLKKMGVEANVFGMNGSLGLVFGSGDVYAISKKVYEFSKKNPALKFFGAVSDGKFIELDAFMEMAKMPSKEMLIGRLIGMINYPLTSLAIVLNEIAKKKGEAVSA